MCPTVRNRVGFVYCVEMETQFHTEGDLVNYPHIHLRTLWNYYYMWSRERCNLLTMRPPRFFEMIGSSVHIDLTCHSHHLDTYSCVEKERGCSREFVENSQQKRQVSIGCSQSLNSSTLARSKTWCVFWGMWSRTVVPWLSWETHHFLGYLRMSVVSLKKPAEMIKHAMQWYEYLYEEKC